MRAQSKAVLALLLSATACLNVVALPQTVSAGDFTAFGPKEYTRRIGAPATSIETFSVRDPDAKYTLHIYNGSMPRQKEGEISSAVIELNGIPILKPSDFSQRITYREVAVGLSKTNILSVQLRSRPGSTITAEITGIDETPPEIVAAVSPAPNAQGWNNSDVTVSFDCSDKTSGIDFCSEPVHVQQEGAGQVITGTATDHAGNSASVSATVSIDKTPPVATVNWPLPGTALQDSPALIKGVVNETLSGVAAVTCNGTNATLSSSSFTCNVPLETGQNNIQILASDVAGNSSQTGLMVAYLGAKYAAIVDVMVSSDKNFNDVPSDYTGLRYDEATSPYIVNAVGQRVTSQHIYARDTTQLFGHPSG